MSRGLLRMLDRNNTVLRGGLHVLYRTIAVQAGATDPQAVMDQCLAEFRGGSLDEATAERFVARLIALSQQVTT